MHRVRKWIAPITLLALWSWSPVPSGTPSSALTVFGSAFAADALPATLVDASKRLAQHATVRARFTQRKTSSLFMEEVVRTGTLELRRTDGRLIWTYDDGPAFLLAGGRFYPAGKDEAQAGKEGAGGFAPPGGGPFGEVMEALFTLEAEPLGRFFTATEDAPGRFTLKPRLKGAGPFLSVGMDVGGEPFALRRVVLTEDGGDATTLDFTEIEPSAVFPETHFDTPAERSKSR